MKLKLALLSALALVAQPALADHYVESNFTVALKFFVNGPYLENDPIDSQTYGTYSIKNFDLIAEYNEVFDGTFTSKAKIIKQDLFGDSGNLLSTKFFFREGTKSVDVTSFFLFEDYEVLVQKLKLNTLTSTGTANAMQTTSFNFTVPYEIEEEEAFIDTRGMEKSARRMVKAGEERVILNTISGTVTGESYFYIIKTDQYRIGLVQGTYKASGGKIIPVPAPIK